MHRKIFLAAVLAAVTLVSCAPEEEVAPAVLDAWARETVEGQTMAAAYLTVSNANAEPIRLVSVSSEAAASASLHRSMVENGIATMRPLAGLVVEGEGTAVLEPGGDHIMLEGLETPLVEGSRIPLTLTFESGEVVRVPVEIVGAGAR